MKSIDFKDFVAKANKIKIFTLAYLYEFYHAKTKKQKTKVKENLAKAVGKGYFVKRGDGVFFPVFKKDRIYHNIIGYENPKKDFYIVCERYGVTPAFSAKVIKEAEKVARVSEKEKKKRRDYTQEYVFTIDGADAKDLDDAISLVKKGKNYLLTVHIADVSFYVREDSSINEEAFARATSIYLVDRVVPMLPKVLSNGICSLNPEEERLTLSIEMLIDSQGNILKSDIYEGLIKSMRRFTYKEVTSLLEDKKPILDIDEKLIPILLDMQNLAQILKRKRLNEGSIDFDIPETKIICDKKSRPIQVIPVERMISHQMIEDFMLTANKAVALFLEKNKIGIFRVHEDPNQDRLENFIATANQIGYKIVGLKDSKQIQAFLEETSGHADSYLLNTLLLRSMQQAYYHHENYGHFGLGFTHYTHFTSPIRRYPDLLIHRLIKKIKKFQKDSKQVLNEKFLQKAAEHCSKQERVAIDMERAIVKRKAIHYLKDKLGVIFSGIVSGVTEMGVYIALDDVGIEGMVMHTLLEKFQYSSDFSEYFKKDVKLKLGTKVNVKLISMNLKKEIIDFQLVDVLI